MPGRLIPFLPAAQGDPSQLLQATPVRCGLSRREFAPILGPAIGRPDLTAGALKAWEDGIVRPPLAVLDAAALIVRRDSPPPPVPMAAKRDAELPTLPERREQLHTTDRTYGDVLSTSLVLAAAPDDRRGSLDDDDLTKRSLTYHIDATSALRAAIDLGRSDMTRRDAIQRMAYAVGALCVPSRDWLLATLDNRNLRPPRIGMTEVDGMRKIFAAFQEMDVCGAGGDRARSALVEYFNTRIAPVLSQHHAPDVRRALFGAASEHTYLAGWMAYEAANHGLAERYLIQSLRLAEESGDELFGAHVLAGMSDQATLLGHPNEGLRLAQAGQQGLRRHPSSAALADLYTLEARAHAKLGHKHAALAAITRAERTFERVRPDIEPEWARFIDVPYLWGEFTNCARDLQLPDLAEGFARRSIHESQRQHRARRGALSTYGLAVAQLQHKDLDAACDTAQHAITLASTVHSARLT